MRFYFSIFLVFVFLSACSGQRYKISTGNMSPTLKIGDVCKAESFGDSSIKRFDVVVFEMPEEVKKLTGEKGSVKIIARIIGLPGERIEIKKGKTFVNDKLLDESFEKVVDNERDFSAIVIPENEYFLLGDNRPESLDSRYWKKPTINRQEISGKISGCN